MKKKDRNVYSKETHYFEFDQDKSDALGKHFQLKNKIYHLSDQTMLYATCWLWSSPNETCQCNIDALHWKTLRFTIQSFFR